MDYLVERFPSYSPQYSFLLASSAPMLGVQIFYFLFLQRINIHIRMTSAFAANAVITILMGVLPQVIDDEKTAYYTELGLTIAYGSILAVLQATLYGVAGPS